MGETIAITKGELERLYKDGGWTNVESDCADDYDKAPDDEIISLGLDDYNELVREARFTSVVNNVNAKYKASMHYKLGVVLHVVAAIAIVCWCVLAVQTFSEVFQLISSV